MLVEPCLLEHCRGQYLVCFASLCSSQLRTRGRNFLSTSLHFVTNSIVRFLSKFILWVSWKPASSQTSFSWALSQVWAFCSFYPLPSLVVSVFIEGEGDCVNRRTVICLVLSVLNWVFVWLFEFFPWVRWFSICKKEQLLMLEVTGE